MTTIVANGQTYTIESLYGYGLYSPTVTSGTGVANLPPWTAIHLDLIADGQAARDAADGYADAAEASAVAAAASAAEAANVAVNSLTATSATSNDVSTGAKTFTLTETDKPFKVGMWVKAYKTDAVSNWVWGEVTAFNPSTELLSVTVTETSGSGTGITNWTLLATGPQGVEGVTPSAASSAEINTGTDTDKFINADALNGSNYGLVPIEFAYISGASPEVGNGAAQVTIPARMNGMDIVAVEAEFTGDVATGSVTTIMLHNATSGQDILSTALTIDASERSSATAATPAVINGSEDDLTTGDVIRLDIDGVGSSNAGTGLVVRALCRRP